MSKEWPKEKPNGLVPLSAEECMRLDEYHKNRRDAIREQAAQQNRAARRLMDNMKSYNTADGVGLQTPAPFAGIQGAVPIDWDRLQQKAATPTPKVSKWIFAEGKHKRVVDAAKFETMYIVYKSYGNWALIGTIGSSDILVSSHKSEPEANAALTTILNQL